MTYRTSFRAHVASAAGSFAVAAGILLAARSADAQVNQKSENLKYFPHDITRDSLIQVMRGFSFALAVRCQHCHAGGNGVSFEGVSFSSDEKVAKQKARYMLQMTDSINEKLLALVPGRSKRCSPRRCSRRAPTRLWRNTGGCA
jgi:hypothetical protein